MGEESGVITAPHKTGVSRRFQFCALEYRPVSQHQELFPGGPVVLLVVKDKTQGLRFLVDPEMRKCVREEDLAYLDALLLDFAERAKLHPDALFQQLCSLAVGPLIVREAGSRSGKYSELLALYSDVIQA
jgi:hypothetical protein